MQWILYRNQYIYVSILKDVSVGEGDVILHKINCASFAMLLNNSVL